MYDLVLFMYLFRLWYHKYSNAKIHKRKRNKNERWVKPVDTDS